MARLAGGIVIACVWALTLLLGAVAVYEYAPVAVSAAKDHPFKTAGYYKGDFVGSPYAPFRRQHLHPTYLFFFPLDPGERVALNNPVVSLTADGFRGEGPRADKPTAVFLGGSAAFGDGASGDQSTIPGQLNRLQDALHFVNAGVPSWNSTQELYRLADQIVPLEPKLVISYGFSNDIAIALDHANAGRGLPSGTPESFDELSKMVDSSRGSASLDVSAYISESLFPRTSGLLRKWFSGVEGPARRAPDERAKAAVRLAVSKYIWNQKVMHALGQSFGFRFVTVIQPMLRTHKNLAPEERANDDGQWPLFEYAVEIALDTGYCRENCLNYSNLFDKDYREIPVFREKNDTRPFETLIFSDTVHLFDAGNAYVARRLARDLALAPSASLRRDFP